ncbi:MAG TPA: hypothetical protein VGD13_11025 [Xanthobacteraceae bacterium]
MTVKSSLTVAAAQQSWPDGNHFRPFQNRENKPMQSRTWMARLEGLRLEGYDANFRPGFARVGGRQLHHPKRQQIPF